jgi:hypothetical protein
MNELSLHSHLTVSPDIVSQELDGELVILSLDRAEYYGLNPTGTRVWNSMTAGMSIGTIAARLAAEYHVDPERARADVLALAESLLAEGLATVTDAPTAP